MCNKKIKLSQTQEMFLLVWRYVNANTLFKIDNN